MASVTPPLGDELILQLRAPVSLGDVEWRELKLTEPTVDQLTKSMKAGIGIEQTAMLLSLNAGIPLAAVQRMKQRDLQDASAFFLHFEASTLTR